MSFIVDVDVDYDHGLPEIAVMDDTRLTGLEELQLGHAVSMSSGQGIGDLAVMEQSATHDT